MSGQFLGVIRILLTAVLSLASAEAIAPSPALSSRRADDVIKVSPLPLG